MNKKATVFLRKYLFLQKHEKTENITIPFKYVVRIMDAYAGKKQKSLKSPLWIDHGMWWKMLNHEYPGLGTEKH